MGQVVRAAKKLKFKGNWRELRMGMNVESEHSNVVGKSPTAWAKVAKAHLDERKDYYSFGLKKGLFSRKEVGLA